MSLVCGVGFWLREFDVFLLSHKFGCTILVSFWLCEFSTFFFGEKSGHNKF